MDGALVAARLILLAVFALAGVAKLANRGAFCAALVEFGLPAPLVPALSVVLPATELLVVAALLPRASAFWAVVAGLLLLAAFSVAIVANLAHGRTPSCQCFGQLSAAPIGWSTLGRNVVFVAVALFVVVQGRDDAGPSTIAWIDRLSTGEAVALAVATVAWVGLAIQGWLLLYLLRRYGELLNRFGPAEASERPRGLPLGTPAPAFSLPDLRGELVTLDRLRSVGKPIALVFVNPACPSCPALFPALGDWQRDVAEQLTTVVVAAGRQQAIEEMAAEHELAHVLLEQRHEVLESYQARGIPSAVIIQANGTIGSLPAVGAEAIRNLITEHLDGVATPLAADPDGRQSPRTPPLIVAQSESLYEKPWTGRIGG
jgi:methylamine dehydrogenase accessory protein MauD